MTDHPARGDNFHKTLQTSDIVFRPVVNDQLSYVTIFFFILGWSLVTGSTIYMLKFVIFLVLFSTLSSQLYISM